MAEQPTQTTKPTTEGTDGGSLDQKTQVPRSFDPEAGDGVTQEGTEGGGLDEKEVPRSFKP